MTKYAPSIESPNYQLFSSAQPPAYADLLFRDHAKLVDTGIL